MRCAFCKKNTHLPMECKSCAVNLCIKCYAPEKHACEKIDEYIFNLKVSLKDQLQSNICKSDKLKFRI